MAFIAMVFVGIALIIAAAMFFAMIVLLILGLVFRKKKKKLSTFFLIISALIFAVLAAVAILIFGPHKAKIEMPDGSVKRVWESKAKDFQTAVEDSDMETVRAMLKKYPALVFYQDINRKTMIEIAAYKGDIDMVQCAIDYGASFDDPLVYSHLVYKGSFDYFFGQYSSLKSDDFKCDVSDMVQFMLEKGAKVEYEDRREPNALFDAVVYAAWDKTFSEDDVKIVRLLIEGGASISEKSLSEDKTAYDYLEDIVKEVNANVNSDEYREIAELLTSGDTDIEGN